MCKFLGLDRVVLYRIARSTNSPLRLRLVPTEILGVRSEVDLARLGFGQFHQVPFKD